MRLTPLEPKAGMAGGIEIVCKVTGKHEVWNQAAAEGWQADLDGEPFNAYYSPQGLNQLGQGSLYHMRGTIHGPIQIKKIK